MILVTLGTQDKPFTRLLQIIEEQIDKGNVNGRVVVQAGCTQFKTEKMDIFDLVPMDKLNRLTEEADFIITHGGVGSIISALKYGKKIIVCPRLYKYGEHINDHQLEITENFSENGYVCALNDGDDLGEVLKKLGSFTPKEFKSNTENMIKIVDEFIEKALK
jgi:UDP-N-acetylglucosamine transferase subunit ALG13